MVKLTAPMMSHWASGQLRGPTVCSSSLRNRRAREGPPAPPPPIVHDLIVTGTLGPDATGDYDEAGIFNGQPYYERTDAAYFIWWWPIPSPPSSFWFLTNVLGNPSGTAWAKHGPMIQPVTGLYIPYANTTGDATVAIP